MSDTVCRDCSRTVDLSHIPPELVPPPDRIQCSRCFVAWLKQHDIWSALPEDFVRAYKVKRKAAREAQG
jgi:hypothetical protein